MIKSEFKASHNYINLKIITTVMNYKKLILSIIYAMWIGFATFQQICWILHGNYNFLALVWYTIMVLSPYFLYKYRN